MNKAELVASVAKKSRISKTSAAAAVDALFDGIRDSLSRGKNVVFAGFGSFSIGKRSARMGRNPQTKEPIKIPAARVPRFRAGKLLKAAVKKGK